VTVTVGVTSAGAVTVTEPVPEAELYVEELEESGVYLAVRVSVPIERTPAGTVMVAEPELRFAGEEVKLPLERTMEPVGVPLEPETAMVTESVCAVVMLEAAGVTVTVGVTSAGAVTVTEPVPEAELYVEELEESGVYLAVRVSAPIERTPAGTVTVAEPELSVVEEDV
jgi:hypothetical protein